MARALELARGAQRVGEPPIGALVVAPGGVIVAEATDETNGRRDFTRHTEVGAVRLACATVGQVLQGCTLYTTVEPCRMCFTSAWARSGEPHRFRLHDARDLGGDRGHAA